MGDFSGAAGLIFFTESVERVARRWALEVDKFVDFTGLQRLSCKVTTNRIQRPPGHSKNLKEVRGRVS
jgi:hypothetical protein